MTPEHPRRLTPYEQYLLREAFDRLGILFDERAEWTGLSEEELLVFVRGSQNK